MRVLMLSKALVLGAYQKKCEELARLPGMELRVVVPPFWAEAGRRAYLERRYTEGYTLVVRNMALNGHFHVHFYPGFGAEVRQFRPDIVHLDEEAYNLATAHGLWVSRRANARTVFFTWQNIYRELPFPFSALERYCLSHADYGMAGNAAAVDVLRRKGFAGPIAIVPQFGVDPELYSRRSVDQAVIPGIDSARGPRPFVVGYVGRLVPQKGLISLLEAVAGLGGDWRLVLLGDGPLRRQLEEHAGKSGILDRVIFIPAVSSVQVPAYLVAMDVVVLPSLTTPNWKEQFGRVLIEAMACEVPVIGSDSGEIPNVIGDAGLVFHEGDVEQLRARLEQLMESADLRQALARAGRQRVLASYTQKAIAKATYCVYEQMLQEVRR